MFLLTDGVCNTDDVQEREPQDKDSLKGTVIITHVLPNLKTYFSGTWTQDIMRNLHKNSYFPLISIVRINNPVEVNVKLFGD